MMRDGARVAVSAACCCATTLLFSDRVPDPVLGYAASKTLLAMLLFAVRGRDVPEIYLRYTECRTTNAELHTVVGRYPCGTGKH